MLTAIAVCVAILVFVIGYIAAVIQDCKEGIRWSRTAHEAAMEAYRQCEKSHEAERRTDALVVDFNRLAKMQNESEKRERGLQSELAKWRDLAQQSEHREIRAELVKPKPKGAKRGPKAKPK